LSGDLKSYEEFLKRAYAEGWRDPIQVTNLEILAYEAGMITERNRVLSLFKDLEGEPVMRVMDMVRRLDSVRNP
jgi:hypothetical protein